MRLGTPRFPAVLSACGFAGSVLAYIGSFAGTLVDSIFPWYFLLFMIGWVVLLLLTPALAYRSLKTFPWRESPRSESPWVVTGTLALMLVAAAHFLWAIAHEGSGVAGIVDGKYALESHGRILKVLTREEYLADRAAGLRSFATILIYLYFPPTMYWWFQRNDRPDQKRA
jgi:hypothetical protein